MLNSGVKCTGCGACEQVCPFDAIIMCSDEFGCLHPVIDPSKCKDCGACERICPLLHEVAPNFNPKCYAVRTKDRDLLAQSSSGGAFTELAGPVLSQGGCVFGCALLDCEARIVKAESLDELSAMRGSKYVQARVGNAFKDCKTELERGRKVLFSGTPCQVAGLKGFLKRDYENLLTVALICHGVTSPRILKDYIRDLETRKGISVHSISFRDKRSRPGEISVVIEGKSGDGGFRQIESWSNVYMRAFLDAYSYRESCFSCKFRSGKSGADIVIGDFWGIKNYTDKFSVAEGVSAVLLYSKKGERAFASLDVDKMPFAYACIARHNHNLENDATPPELRKEFLDHLRQGGSLIGFFARLDYVPLWKRLLKLPLRAVRKIVRSLKKRR